MMINEDLLLALVSFVAATLIWFLWSLFRDEAMLRKLEAEYPRLIEGASLTCRPHKWGRVKLDFQQLPLDTYTVCVECGTVAGYELRLNDAGKAAAAKAIAATEAQERQTKAMLERRDMLLMYQKETQVKKNLAIFMEATGSEEAMRAIMGDLFDSAIKSEREISEKLVWEFSEQTDLK